MVGIGVITDCEQFSVHGGGAGGKGMSPAFIVAETQRASREIAITRFMVGGSDL